MALSSLGVFLLELEIKARVAAAQSDGWVRNSLRTQERASGETRPTTPRPPPHSRAVTKHLFVVTCLVCGVWL